MRRAFLAAALPLVLAAVPCTAQDALALRPSLAMVPQITGPSAAAPAGGKGFRFAGDALMRYEWTRESPDATPVTDEDGDGDTNRWRIQARPRIELSAGPFRSAVGGEFNYSQDENDAPIFGQPPELIRDNYRSREARVDLAWGRVKFGPVAAQGGRFPMPLPVTEMIWDADLRPQGGAATLAFGGENGSGVRFVASGIYATGSHVYEDESEMYGGGAELQFLSSRSVSLQLAGSYLQFENLGKLEPSIRRQNTRLEGLFLYDYQVVDLVATLTQGGQMPVTLVADYCWNTAVDSGNKGLWLSAILGSTDISRARAEYTYAKVDRDATVAAFNTDDFLWGTGWEGHRADLSTATSSHGSIHAIAQWQRFKDSPDPVVAAHWIKRWRVEVRTTF